MELSPKISLNIPDSNKQGKYFSFRLKQKLYYEPSEFSMPGKMLALSDIEGNFMALVKLLHKNKIIDKYLKWTFGDGHLVIVGDCFDRGEQVVECLWLIYSLEEKARKKGGYVHFILGNHEIMNMNGDWRYIHPKYARSTRTSYTAIYDGNSELWRWLSTKNIIEKIGDILFVHGGIAKEILNFNLSIHELNSRIRPYYSKANELFEDAFLNLVFDGDKSPFWYRGYYKAGADGNLIDSTLKTFGVNTIVTGHTVMPQITPFFDGKVINIDTDHAAGNSEALFISKGIFYRILVNGKRMRIK